MEGKENEILLSLPSQFILCFKTEMFVKVKHDPNLRKMFLGSSFK